MTRERAELASETLEDVFTVAGDAVTIGRVNVGPEGAYAYISGVHHQGWYPIDSLTAREDI